MSIPGLDAAQARYDAASPPDEHECEDDDCSCEQKAQDAYDDAQIERADARRKGDEFA
jgi:hypothetical protein